MTLTEAKAICRDYGCTLTTERDGGRVYFRVKAPGALAQYTTDIEAAVDLCRTLYTRKVIKGD